MERLNLAEALASDRLDDFAAQAEADGIGPADRAQFDAIERGDHLKLFSEKVQIAVD